MFQSEFSILHSGGGDAVADENHALGHLWLAASMRIGGFRPRATPSAISSAVDFGVVSTAPSRRHHAVHVYNAMASLFTPRSGVIARCLTTPEVTAELIADGRTCTRRRNRHAHAAASQRCQRRDSPSATASPHRNAECEIHFGNI